MPDLRDSIQSSLASFTGQAMRPASAAFFANLGYRSDRTLAIDTVATLKEQLDPGGFLREENALLSLWKSVHLIFQLTKSELAPSAGNDLGLILETPFELRRDGKVIESYIFFAVDLHPRPDGQPHTRETYGTITRALNRLVPQPVLVLFREDARLSLAVINRRRNLRDGTRDVLTRVSLIRDIDVHSPHRAHLDLLQRFSLPSLSSESAIRTFADLDTAWQKLFSIQELKDSFYKSLSAWFRWATKEIQLAQLPDQTPDTTAARSRATDEFTVRLICRTLFTWFLKEMRLIPAELLELYDTAENRRVLTKGADSTSFLEGNHYYRGILQNIFFQSLNRPMDQRRKSGPEATNDREVTDPNLKKLAYIGKQNLPDNFDYTLFDRIPYLNGGLFDALPEDNLKFTHEEGNAFKVPNKLFYARCEDGFSLPREGRSAAQPMEGLNRIFDRYRFTVAENTPLEEDVALDPELLGLVFENLLAEIDPDDEAAAKSARKASGSYYTPRRIVDYMVNEALHLHLRTEFEKNAATPTDLQLLSQLCYELDPHADFSPIAARVVDVLEAVRVLDPACGSGAFPMGMLHRMVELLRCVDPRNELWIQRLLSRIPAGLRADAARGLEGKSYNYLRKLGLIQKNLYGLDIQPLATLIAKLRFFLTLVVEQEIHLADSAHNYGLSSLPNLETNLICANTLADVGHGLLSGSVLAELRQAREEYYQPTTTRIRRDELGKSIGEQLAAIFPGFAEKAKGVIPAGATVMDRGNMRRQQDAYWLAEWFKHATIAAPFFNVETFFPELISDGENHHPAPFHIVIGNPPYGGTMISDEVKDALGLRSKDPYGAFIARFLGDPARPSPLAEGGVLAYIVSDTFMTIWTHRPLREQMLRHRVHKMIRVSKDTFSATVNCAVILCQRGAALETHSCQMADLTNISIWTQQEYFLHLLYQTEGFTRRANVSNQTYAIYHYRQNLIQTNSNVPFFVASPKLFALMNDTNASVTNEILDGNRVAVRTVTINGNAVRLFKLGEIADVNVGLQTGDNPGYLFQNPDARGSYRSIEGHRQFLLTVAELERIGSDESLRNEVVNHGISKDQEDSRRYFGGRYIVPYDKGGESSSQEGWMPNYWVPTDYFIDWSEWAISRMKSLTLREKNRLQGKTGGNDRLTSRFQNHEFYFKHGLTWSDAGVYSPTIRLSGSGVFDVKGSRFIVDQSRRYTALGIVCSKLAKMWIKAIGNHSISTQSENIRDLIIPLEVSDSIDVLVSSVIAKQKIDLGYDYASNEQLEIDRLVYAAYGLNDSDTKEVENWYARRYPPLAEAQRRNLATKQGKTEEQLINRPVFHLYCDESCHLPADGEPNMLLGLVSCPVGEVAPAHTKLRALAATSGLEPHFEAKWTKLSPARLPHYLSLLEWFFAPEQDALSFRALVLPDKARLYAALPETARDHLYYRLYYQLLRAAVEPENRHRIFLDTKDTRGGQKISKLRDLLQLDAGDSLQTAKAIQDIQLVRSHEIGLLQLTDLFLGAIAYARRGLHSSAAKLAFIHALEEKIGSPLTADTPPGNAKFLIATEHDQDALLL